MTERVQRERKAKKRDVDAPKKTETVDTEALKAEMDSMLDEIDSVLEENAQEFVDNFVQKGGE